LLSSCFEQSDQRFRTNRWSDISVVQDLFDTLKVFQMELVLPPIKIGYTSSALVIDISQIKEYSTMKPFAMINPVIEEFSDDEVSLEEGCLSVPTFTRST